MKTIFILTFLSCSFLFGQTLDDFKSMLGKEMSSNKKFIDFESKLGSYEYDSGRGSYHKMFYRAGVELIILGDKNNISKSDKLHAIFLMGPSVEWYATYKGELPLGLKWGMTLTQVEALLGKAEKHHLFGDDYVYRYYKHNIELSYTDDGTPKLLDIQIRTF